MFGTPSEQSGPSKHKRRAGFTLVEVILVAVVITIITGIALPYFAGSYKGNKLRLSARTVSRMARYARAMSIMREEQMTVVLNHETMEVWLGGFTAAKTNSADGELDQDVLDRLGYTDGKSDAGKDAGIEKEHHKFLPDGLSVKVFEKDWTEEDDNYQDLYMIRFFPNGQCEWFELELEDNRGVSIRMENDPISGKIKSEFLQ
ncbi:prepilin-type N-terminal cleavage/methylation domain-containing protein [Pontiellaceae bacterium B12227]|nr:prepilin-type N-terminal cleavage/methylation domain-containing protein [Pontiellaceae bacterium B12227]